jgi:hypothetical protein
MIGLIVLVVAGVLVYLLSRATGGRLGIMHVLAILVGVLLLLGGAGTAVCGGFVAVVPDQGMSGLRLIGLICLAVGAGVLYAGFWVVRATWRNAKAQQPPMPPAPTGGPTEPPATSGS